MKPKKNLTSDVKIGFVLTILYVLSMTCTKLSILCLYIRVLTYDYVRLAAKTLLGVVLVSHAYILATLLTACIPLDAYWDLAKRPAADCRGLPYFWSHAGLNIATDVLIFVLPLTVLHRVRSPRPQKIALSVVFLLAFRYVVTIHLFTYPPYLPNTLPTIPLTPNIYHPSHLPPLPKINPK